MLGVGSFPPAWYCCDPELARFPVLLPTSARLSPRFPTILSALPEDMKGSSVSLWRASRSWGDTEGAPETSGVVEGSLWGSEETEGLGVGLEEF